MKWTRKPSVTKPPVLRPMGWEPVLSAKYVPYMKRFLLLLLIAIPLLLLSACSKAVSITPMPAPPANLASDCPQLLSVPEPFLDPDRLIWEMSILSAYADCAAKHRMAIEAWRSAVNSTE